MSGDFEPHDGMGCPFAVGVWVETLRRDGSVQCKVVQEKSRRTDIWYESDGRPWISVWAWAVNGRGEAYAYGDVVAYRVIDRFREQRSALFRSLLDAPAPEVEVA